MSIKIGDEHDDTHSLEIDAIAEQNPDLPFSLIREILLADAEEATSEYRKGDM